jgi:hypothetical protein
VASCSKEQCSGNGSGVVARERSVVESCIARKSVVAGCAVAVVCSKEGCSGRHSCYALLATTPFLATTPLSLSPSPCCNSALLAATLSLLQLRALPATTLLPGSQSVAARRAELWQGEGSKSVVARRVEL